MFRAAFNAGQWLVPPPSDADKLGLTDTELDNLVTANKDRNDLYTSVLSSVLNALAIMLLGFVSCNICFYLCHLYIIVHDYDDYQGHTLEALA